MRVLTGLLPLALLLNAGFAAAEPTPLKLNGQEVDFAFWAPAKPDFDPADASLSAGRRAFFEAEGIDTAQGLYRSEIHFGRDGSVEEREITVRHLMTRAAVHDRGNQAHWVDGFAEVARIEEAYTLLPDGRRIPVEAATLQLRADDEDDIFTDSFEIIVPYQGLKPGAASVLVVRTQQRPGGRALPFSRIFYPQVFTHQERFEVEVTWDQGMKPPRWQSDAEALTCTTPEPRRLSCRAEGLEPYPTDSDVRYSDALPTLVVAADTTWEALAEQVQGYVQGAYSQAAELDGDLEAILAGAQDTDEMLARIHAFVSQEVRYLGLEHGLGGVIPRPTSLTLQRRFGDCKDKAVLFVDLARRAGLEAYPVLTSTRRKNLDKLMIPAASYFNHMVACVRLPGKDGEEDRELCLDLTDSIAAYDALSSGVQTAVRLDVKPGTEAPGHLPGAPYTWTYDLQVETRLKEDGSLAETKDRTYGGANASWLRRRLQSRNRKERDEWLRKEFENDHIEEVELRSIEAEGIDRNGRTAVIRSEAHLKESFNPENLRNFSDWENELIDEVTWFKSENKSHDYHFDGLRYRSERVFHLPPGLKPAHPGALVDFQSPYGRYQRSYRLEEDRIVVTAELAMPRARIAREEIPRFNRFIDHVADHARIYFDVRRRGSSS